MIYRLTGQITEVTKEAVVLKTGSVEWYIEVSRTTAAQVSSVKGEISILTYLHHREDVLQLFGFATEKEKKVFHSLLTVQGIGPKAAIKILSGITPDDFLLALNSENISRLEMIPGLGKKTAQKVLLTLAGKLILDDGIQHGASLNFQSTHLRGPWNDIEDALISMGFDRKHVRDELPNQIIHLSKTVPELNDHQNEPSQGLLDEFSKHVMKLDKIQREKLEGELLKSCILALS